MTTLTLSVANLSDWVGKELDVERAHRESPFGAPVAHGYLTLALLAEMNMDIGVVPEDAVAAFNCGIDKVRFMTPVKAGARVRTRTTLAEVTAKEGGRKLVKLVSAIEIEGEAKPALVAETLAMLVGPA